LHVPAQVQAAARADIPTLVLIRDPIHAIVSLMIHSPFVSLSQAVRAYMHFYRDLHRFSGSFVLSEFKETTSNFGAAIERVNSSFGSEFGVFEHTEESVARCFEVINNRNRQRFGGDVDERSIARPSKPRAEIADMMRRQLREPPCASRVRPCVDLYRSLTQHEAVARDD
jgi:hypothetical protein